MGVFVTVERWGRGNPVLKVARIVNENGIEIKMAVEDFISQVVQEIGYSVITAVTPAQLEKKITDAVQVVVKQVKDTTITVAENVH